MDKPLVIGKHSFFKSRLILGTGKFNSTDVMEKALEASGCEMVTVAVRRVDLKDPKDPIVSHIDTKKYKILPNTAGCYTAEDAIRTSFLAREVGISDMVKLEVIGDKQTLYPDTEELLNATKVLVKEGFTVLPYTTDDLVTALKLQDAGASCVMPLGAPIGSGLGILNPINIRIIIDRVKVPVIVDAGVGTASDVAVAMELGAEGVLLNSGVALAKDPVMMARAVRDGLTAGRQAYLAGRISKSNYAIPSSPESGRIE